MNGKQKKVLIAVAAVVLGMLLYPPFQWKGPGGSVASMGYHWIFAPPLYNDLVAPAMNPYAKTVNIGLLITQWIAVLIIGVIAYLFFKDSPP